MRKELNEVTYEVFVSGRKCVLQQAKQHLAINLKCLLQQKQVHSARHKDIIRRKTVLVWR